MNEPLEYIRVFNIFIAVLALVLNLMKGYYLKLHKTMGVDSMMGFMAVLSWCGCYALAATLAAFEGVETGLWTVIMGVPNVWTLTAGLMGWKKVAW